MLVDILNNLYEERNILSRNIDCAESYEEEQELLNEYEKNNTIIRSFPQIIATLSNEIHRYESFCRNQNNYDNTLSIMKIANRLRLKVELEEMEINNETYNKILLDKLKMNADNKGFEEAEDFDAERYDIFMKTIKKEMGVIKQ